MIRLSANVSKKLPIPGEQFSSQQFGASMEIEVSDADQPEIIQARIRDLYALISTAIDEQLAGANGQAGAKPRPAPAPLPQNRLPAQARAQQPAPKGGDGNGGKRAVTATEAQQKAIYAICKGLGVEVKDVLADYHVARSRDLTVKDASRLIDELKRREAANQQG